MMATMAGKAVDRPAVNFYEINGMEPTDGADPYNIYSHPSWRPLIELARERTDRIVMRGVPFVNAPPDPVADVQTVETREEGDSRFGSLTIRAPGRTLTARSRRDKDVNTTWTLEHLLKDVDDMKAFLALPEAAFGGEPDPTGVLETERALGETGIVMIDTGDPICAAASLFDMGEYTVIAMTELELFHAVLERFERKILPRVEAIAKALPGRLWRIYGPEYAAPPYLPPRLFHEYVVRYDKPMVEAIQRYGGYARIHSHGRLEAILDEIAATGCDGLDPIEPPPQGDVALEYVRRNYGRQLVLFGNLEVSDIENLPADAFAGQVERAIREGTAGEGRGFVLQASACPYGRVLSERALRNYEKMVKLIERG